MTRRATTGPTASMWGTGAEILQAFLDAIIQSSLSEGDKQAVISETDTVARDVSNEGKLSKRAQILWRGIKNVIKAIPNAVKAWKEVTKLWS